MTEGRRPPSGTAFQPKYGVPCLIYYGTIRHRPQGDHAVHLKSAHAGPRAGVILLAACLVNTPARAQNPEVPVVPGDTIQVDVDGRSVRVWRGGTCGGGAGPTVVFESGLGSSLRTWRTLTPLLAPSTTMIAYDRAGIGGSEPSTGGRDSETIARELHRLLGVLDVPPPYILVAHSLGGLHARLYAAMYPADVAGLVLIDPTPERLRDRMQLSDEVLGRVDSLNAIYQAQNPPGVRDEATAMPLSERQAAAARLTVPLFLLASLQRPLLEPTDWYTQDMIDRSWELKRDIQLELVHRVPGAGYRGIEDAGHFIHQEQPDAVAAAVEWVIAQARARELVPAR